MNWWDDRPEWMARANCKGMDTNAFFVKVGESVKDVKAVCSGCSVREECLDYALVKNIMHGIYGGMSQRERARIRTRRIRQGDWKREIA